jgi:predicted AAA+ superfamily ATPase
MKYIKRAIEDDILNDLSTKSKVILIYGIRRVGKTQLIKHIIQQTSMEYLLLNGENIEHTDLLKTRSTANYKRLLGKKKLLIIDEAQAIPEIGIKLKLMIDTIPDLKILATGSSSFDLNNQVGEPLVGRKKEYKLFPLAQMELSYYEDYLTTRSNLEERLIFGGYPELIHLDERNEKIEYLKDQINSYLLKDIIAFEGVKKRDKIVSLLKIIAFRVGSEISLEGIGRELQISKNTVDKYLDLLSKLFVIHKVSGFSRNLDNEITKKSKWFFMDNGIRNAIISNFNNFELRDDIGKLWENYFISERIKYQSYHRMQVNNYFWRHKNQQEIDWVEETESGLSAFEIKWNPDAKVRIPKQWEKAYSTARFIVLNRDNFLDFITDI